MKTTGSARATKLLRMPKVLLLCLFVVIALPSVGQNEKWAKWEEQADTLSSQGRYPEAVKLYTKVIDASGLKERSAFGSLYKRAISYYSMEEYSLALKDLNRFIQSFPDFPQARMLRALIHKELGNTEEQMKDLADALDSRPFGLPPLWSAAPSFHDPAFRF